MTLTLAGPAFAEGSWSSSMGGVLVGFDSRWWSDGDRDNVGTTISFTGCSTSSSTDSSVTVQLSRYRPVIADVNEGQKTFTACMSGGTSSGNWGDKQAADYRFSIMKINGATQYVNLSVNNVSVKY
ncbi:hypothetical protein ACFVZW_18290 [Streptomyces sp. NPDC059567]|uniref:hypothetical protein n=1 Tax=Streptomyces sp. NPDC059567 TaxID=3346867 RepID=UPI0036AE2206